MAKKLFADGNDGTVAIYDPAVPAALTDPLNNLQSVYFHSLLDYVAVAEVFDVTVTHPQRASSGSQSPQHAYLTPNPVSGEVNSLSHDLGYQPHGLVFVGNNMLPANSQIQNVGTSFRTVAVEIDASVARIFETAWVYQHALPAMTQTYKIVLFSQPIQPVSPKSIDIHPTRFLASRGKLDTENNYLRRAASNPMFYFSKGKTADVNNGSFRIVTANGATITRSPYAGSFTGAPGIGVEV